MTASTCSMLPLHFWHLLFCQIPYNLLLDEFEIAPIDLSFVGQHLLLLANLVQ
ncbi:uncharacterized protein DS421_5g157240 [Arachis hypogaea]|nr:uncharacterized protein DS421_5g157240 [Arachis hypogaea]